MKKYIVSGIIALVVSVGTWFVLPAKTQQQIQKLGGTVENFPVLFYNGMYGGNSSQFAVSSAGAVTSAGLTNTGALSATTAITAATYNTATVGTSSSSPAALGSASAGHFIVAAAATTASASSTAVTANSTIKLQLEATTPIAGTTCNTTITTASSTAIITSKIASNGFTVTTAGAPTTNPFCYGYVITN